MKKVNIYFTIVKIILDYAIIVWVFFMSREIRLVTDLLPSINLPIQTILAEELVKFSLIWASVLVLIFLIHWLYKFDSSWWRVKEFSKILLYSFYSFVFFTVIVYLWQWFIFSTEIPRLIIIFTYFFWSIFLILERLLISFFRTHLFKKWVLSKSRIFIISNKSCRESHSLINSFVKSHDYEVVWVSESIKFELEWIKKVNFEDLTKMIKKREIDELLYVSNAYKNDELIELWELSRIFWVKYRYLANSFELAKSNTAMTLINGIPALEIKSTSLSGWNTIIKRIIDIVIWILWLVIFSPIIFIVSILIKLEDSSWPIIFKNRRVWRYWEEFDLYKFRYMKWKYCTKDSYKVSKKVKEEALEYEENLINSSSSRSWPLYKIQNDPRKTKIWAFIEKYSIDEIPQFLNVIIWNMSLIWPRPHQTREVDKYLTKHIRLLTIKPWITWMSQVNGRETNNFDDEANLDIYYIENWSILLDIKILFKTIYVVLTRK